MNATTLRMVRAAVLTALALVIVQLAVFCAPDPAPWRHGGMANPGGLRLRDVPLLVVSGPPIWGVLYAFLTASERDRQRRMSLARRRDVRTPRS